MAVIHGAGAAQVNGVETLQYSEHILRNMKAWEKQAGKAWRRRVDDTPENKSTGRNMTNDCFKPIDVQRENKFVSCGSSLIWQSWR